VTIIVLGFWLYISHKYFVIPIPLRIILLSNAYGALQLHNIRVHQRIPPVKKIQKNSYKKKESFHTSPNFLETPVTLCRLPQLPDSSTSLCPKVPKALLRLSDTEYRY
jgi:hypothetical protein